jgi:monoamine oxidase
MGGETIMHRRHDVVVVGAGIAGLFCSLHLKKTKNVGVYEVSSRLGGRIETWRIDPKASDDLEFTTIPVSKLRDEDREPATQNRSKFFVAEFGPMRIEPEHQPYLAKLLSDLKIRDEKGAEKWSDLVPFPPYRGDPPTEPKFTLEGEEAAQTTLLDLLLLAFRRVCEAMSFDGVINETPWELIVSDNRTIPYDDANFFWREFRNDNFLLRQYWKRSLRQWINLLNEDHYRYIRQRAMFRGTLLRDMGFWNLLGSVLSHMATVKLRDWASFYHLLPENPSAAEWFIFWLRAIKSTDSLRGIRGGMDWVVHTLCREKLGLEIEFPENSDHIYPIYKDNRGQGDTAGPDVRLFLRKKLVKVIEVAGIDPHIQLIFHNAPNDTRETELDDAWQTEIVRADDVILAIPKSALQEIQFEFNGAESGTEKQNKDRQIQEALDVLLDSVASVPLLKCFFILKNPFWEDDRPASRYAYTTPTRELHYQKNDDKTRGMIMIYTDRPGTQFWSDYLVDDLKVDLGKFGLPLAAFKSVRRHQPNAQVWKWEKQSDLSGWGSRKFAKNDRLLRTFLSYAREEGADSTTADRLLVAGMHDWGLKPFEGACHAWRPGSDPNAVMKHFQAFSLGGSKKRLHICGEAYSDYQGFIEGALRSAAGVLMNAFGIAESDLHKQVDRQLVNTVRVPPEAKTRLDELNAKSVNTASSRATTRRAASSNMNVPKQRVTTIDRDSAPPLSARNTRRRSARKP